MSFRNGRPVNNNSTSLQLSDVLPAGVSFPFRGISAPAGFFIEDGSAVSRTTYANLFANIVTANGFTTQTFTVTIATPAVFTKASHGFLGGERVRLSTTGALPTGLNNSTDYYVLFVSSSTFNVSLTAGGAAINTTGTQSGVHSYLRSLYGLGDGSTTFNIPDSRGRVSIGSGTYTDSVSGSVVRNLGQHIGAEAHLLTATQTGVAAHTHNHPHTHTVATQYWNSASAPAGNAFTDTNNLSAATQDGLTPAVTSTANTAVGSASTNTVPDPTTASAANSHNNMQPALVATHIIKY